MSKKQILQYLKKNNTCVLATCHNNKTEAATVLYAVDDDFIFYIITSKYYRKYKNLAKNKNVSLVIGFQMPTIQIDAKAEFLGPKKIKLVKPFILKKLPEVKEYLEEEDTVCLKIIPKYLQMVDVVSGEEKIEKIKF